jgi:hypothetical protein
MKCDHFVSALLLRLKNAHPCMIFDELHFRTDLLANCAIVGAKGLAHRVHGLLLLNEFLLEHVIAIQHLLFGSNVLSSLLSIFNRFVRVHQEMDVPFSCRIKSLYIIQNLTFDFL